MPAYRNVSRALIAPLAALLVLSAPSATRAAASPASQSADIQGLFLSPDLSLDPPQGLLADAWYKLELLNQPVGYMRCAIRRNGDRIETLDYTQLRIARGPVTVKVVVKNLTVETIDGRPLEIHTEQVFANNPIRYDAKFAPDGSIDLEITQSGNKVTRRLPAAPDATFPWQMVRQILSGQRKPGESFTERGYAFVADTKPMAVEHTAVREVDLELPGCKSVRAYLYKVSNAGMGGDGDVYCEPRILTPLKFDMPVLGMHFIATITTRQQATAAVENPAELFVSTMLKAKVTGSLDPTQAGSVLYTMQLADESPIDLLTTGMQKVIRQQGRTLQVRVSRRKPSAAQPGQAPLPPEMEKYLASTTYCNIDDEAVRQLAIEGAAGEKDPHRLAEKLTRYVYRKMKHKGLDVAFATASEAARTLQGDCTEHATLLAALARANGLPARGVFGMVALPDSFADGTLTYGYHMWTQVYVAGRWIDLDAALNQPIPDATHIALGLSDLADTSIQTESIQTFMQLAGKIQLTASPSR